MAAVVIDNPILNSPFSDAVGAGGEQPCSFGRWAFEEVTDPWDTKSVIRHAIAGAVMPA